jgi:transcriptional regulator of acetoin/glycerol metabolism
VTARRQYFEEGLVPAGVPNAVLRSWQRCWEAGHQANRPICFELISRGRTREIDERGRSLVEAGSAEVDHLASVVSNARMIVVLTDASGAVVQTAGDVAAVTPRLKPAARIGVDFSETTLGTNAIGTALVERGPVTVIAREHYFESNSMFTCAAAPVFAPDGGLIGCLDISGEYHPERPDFFDLVVTSARAIENRMLHGLPDALLLGFSARDELLGTPWEAILAFDPAGGLVGGNAAARRLLGLRGAPRGVRFEDLFETRFAESLRNIGQHERAWTLQSVSGLSVRARLCEREAGAHRAKRAGPPRDTGKRDSTLAFLRILSRDKATADAVGRARCAYDRGVPTLLVGETGTGKEVVARALHYGGARADGPFIAVNCASLPDSLVEAELFGYAEGAFTGARRGGAQGRIELANGGTLFLDEIGDMPVASQAKLLRVLQERCVFRLGDTRERPIDIALICATHQDLPWLIAEKAFREDLYYRVNGFCVTLPPLRQRGNILELARHLLEQESHGVHQFSERAAQLLLTHPWPGNLRQLSHVITTTVALAGSSGVIEPAHFPEDFVNQAAREAEPPASARECTQRLPSLDQAEAELIERTIRACRGNVSAAARTLGVSRSTLYNRFKRS